MKDSNERPSRFTYKVDFSTLSFPNWQHYTLSDQWNNRGDKSVKVCTNCQTIYNDAAEPCICTFDFGRHTVYHPIWPLIIVGATISGLLIYFLIVVFGGSN